MTDQVTEKLLTIASNAANQSRDEIVSLLTAPKWSQTGGWYDYDWRNYVSTAVADEWDSLSLDAKLVAFIHASERIEP